MRDREIICPCERHKRDIAETGHCICHLFVSETYQPAEEERPAIPDTNVSWPHIVVYGASWCRDTLRTKRFLNRNGVPYIMVDVDQDLQAAQRVKGWNRGYLSTPTLDIEGHIVIEPSDEELAGLLGIVQKARF